MKKETILNSATRISLLIISFSLPFLVYFDKIEGKDFISLCSVVFTFYFSNKKIWDSHNQ